MSDDVGVIGSVAHCIPQRSDGHSDKRGKAGVEDVEALVLVGLGFEASSGAGEEMRTSAGGADANDAGKHEGIVILTQVVISFSRCIAPFGNPGRLRERSGLFDAAWRKTVSRSAHNREIVGSNPTAATNPTCASLTPALQ